MTAETSEHVPSRAVNAGGLYVVLYSLSYEPESLHGNIELREHKNHGPRDLTAAVAASCCTSSVFDYLVSHSGIMVKLSLIHI